MDPAANPYNPGAGLAPPALAGREAETEAWITLLRRVGNGLSGRAPVFVGLRGVGKTVLLSQLRDLSESAGWLACSVEARPGDDGAAHLRRRIARELLAASRRNSPRSLSAKLKDALGSVVSFSAKAGVSGIAIGVERRVGRADSGELDTDLTELVEDVAPTMQAEGRGMAIFCDEMQELDDVGITALLVAAHQAAQRGWPFFVAGAGLPTLPHRLAVVRSYSERLFDFRPIGALSPTDAARALVVPARQRGVEFEPAALDELTKASGGYPYFLQEFGQAAWNAAPRSPITADDAAAGIALGVASLDEGFFRTRWERATSAERALLRALAEEGDEADTRALAARMGKGARSISPARASLLAKGIVYAPARGRLAFTVPGMGAFIDRLAD